MNMDYFKKCTLITGWSAFAICVIVHFLTMEPTSSFWDCSEYIATAFRLEVMHPPGAPLFMMIARLFGMLAPSPEYAPAMMNFMAVLCSGFTILFMCWSIIHFGRKMYGRSREQLTRPQIWTVCGAAFVGSMVYTFSDTFWFSSVETETYAMASMLVAAVVWAMLQWENVAGQPGANRWLVLIAYLLGLSIGVRVIPLLTIPALVYIYYYRMYPETTWKGVVWATLAALALLLAVNGIIIRYTIKVGSLVDRWFVNGFGAPINTGIVFFALLLFGLCAWGIWTTHKRGRVTANTLLLCLTVILIGYTSYAAVTIRAIANPPMNSNNPNNPYAVESFINRDQYGSVPLLYGQWYSSPIIDYTTKKAWYVDDDGTYSEYDRINKYIYPSELKTLFPRMYDSQKAEEYAAWGNVKGHKIPYADELITVPTFGENLGYMFNYQLNYMYWRYFLWNFVGRQSDHQGNGSLIDGNWLSGIKFIDQLYLGPQDYLPAELENNRGRNKYYFLPFILGLIGLLYQLNRDGRNFSVILWLFVMMGIAVIMYFNPTPGEPRERDYIFQGSFYAFSLWIGLGVIWVRDMFAKYAKKENIQVAVAATAVCLSVPALMAAQNWDDHDRSNRYLAWDTGYNYLTACLPNSIIMNYGDNDTFPLWLNQEVGGVRPDVKIMNMSYLGMDWYIDQMKQKTHAADPVPFSLPRNKYVGSNGDFIRIYEVFDHPVNIKQVIDFVRRDDANTKLPYSDGSLEDYIPARQLAIPVNRENAVSSGIVRPEDAHLMVDTVYIKLEKSAVMKHELMFLDLLANFDWDRPLFFTQVYSLSDFGLQDYLQFDGFAYRLVPIKTERGRFHSGRIDTYYMYDNIMNKFRYGNVADPKVYKDAFLHNTLASSHSRAAFAFLGKELAQRGDTVRAVEVLDAGLEKIPFEATRWSYMVYAYIEAYYVAGEFDKGNDILTAYATNLMEYLVYLVQFEGRKADKVYNDLLDNFYYLESIEKLAMTYGQQEEAEWIADFFTRLGMV